MNRRWTHPRRVAVDDDAFAVGHHLTRLLVVPVVVEVGGGAWEARGQRYCLVSLLGGGGLREGSWQGSAGVR